MRDFRGRALWIVPDDYSQRELSTINEAVRSTWMHLVWLTGKHLSGESPLPRPNDQAILLAGLRPYAMIDKSDYQFTSPLALLERHRQDASAAVGIVVTDLRASTSGIMSLVGAI